MRKKRDDPDMDALSIRGNEQNKMDHAIRGMAKRQCE
jgi:hypothetical protein